MQMVQIYVLYVNQQKLKSYIKFIVYTIYYIPEPHLIVNLQNMYLLKM